MVYLNITDVLNQWAQWGVFAYVLPFLMIFAVVFGILSKTNLLGSSKGVQATIALAFGLLALQFDFVANFFASIFPYAGIGISVLLVALILMGMFGTDTFRGWWFFGIGVMIFVVIVLSSLSDLSWIGGRGYALADAWPMILLVLIILGLMALVMFGPKQNEPRQNG